MKQAILLCILGAFSLNFIGGQTESIDHFYNKYRGVDGALNISVGSFLINIGSWFVEDYQTRELVRKAQRVKLIVFEDENMIRAKDLDELLRGVKKESFEELMTVREDGSEVKIYAREERDFVRNLLILIDESDQFVLVSLKCRMTYDDLNELIADTDSF